MFRSMVEIIGAIIADAPVSENASHRKTRFYALIFLFAATLLASALVLR